MDNEESEDEDAGPCKLVDGLRLPLKPGTASGFLGVQRSTSKKCPWQALLKVPGRKRLNVGSFKSAEKAAVARARAKAAGGVLLDSPRKQAARKLGASPTLVMRLTLIPIPFSLLLFTRTCTGKQSMANVLEPVTDPVAYQCSRVLTSPVNGPLLSDGAPLAAQPQPLLYIPPYSAAYGVQNARPLPSGQPLPQGVKAFGLALPAQQQS